MERVGMAGDLTFVFFHWHMSNNCPSKQCPYTYLQAPLVSRGGVQVEEVFLPNNHPQ